jgi:hypothetical protein
LVWKDLLDSLRNHSALVVLLSPFFLAVLFQTLSKPEDLKAIPVALVAPGESGLARVLKQHPGLELQPVPSRPVALEVLASRRCVLVLEVEGDFDSRLQQGQRPVLKIWADPSRPTPAALAREYVRACLREQGGQRLPARIESQIAAQARPRFNWLASALLLACMSPMVLSASSWSEEKESGTLPLLLLSPLPSALCWLGKCSVAAGLGLVAGLVVVAWVKLPWAVWGSLLLWMSLGSLVFAALGGIIGLLAKGPTAASSWTGLCFIAFFAPASLAETSQSLSRWAKVSPAFYLFDGLQRTALAQESASSQSFTVLALMLFAIILTGLGVHLLRAHR